MTRRVAPAHTALAFAGRLPKSSASEPRQQRTSCIRAKPGRRRVLRAESPSGFRSSSGATPTVATVVLPENLKVSRVHASLELRGDELYVRDARSGERHGGERADRSRPRPGCRSVVGDVPREFAISDWLFTVACVQPPQALTVAASSFGNETGRRVLGLHATIASDALADTGMAFPAMPSLGAPPTAPQPDQ